MFTWFWSGFSSSILLIRSSNEISFSEMFLIWSMVRTVSVFSLDLLVRFWFWTSREFNHSIKLWFNSLCCCLKAFKSFLNWPISFMLSRLDNNYNFYQKYSCKPFKCDTFKCFTAMLIRSLKLISQQYLHVIFMNFCSNLNQY